MLPPETDSSHSDPSIPDYKPSINDNDAVALAENVLRRLHYESFAYQWVYDCLVRRAQIMFIVSEVAALLTALMGLFTSLAPDAQLYGGLITSSLAIIVATAMKISSRLYPAGRFNRIRRYLDHVRKRLAKYKSLPTNMLADVIKADYRKLQQMWTEAPGLTVEQRRMTGQLFEKV